MPKLECIKKLPTFSFRRKAVWIPLLQEFIRSGKKFMKVNFGKSHSLEQARCGLRAAMFYHEEFKTKIEIRQINNKIYLIKKEAKR